MNFIASIAQPVVNLAILSIAAFCIKQKYTRHELRLGLTFAAIYITEGILASNFNFDVVSGQQWNWIGKLAVLLAALLYVYFNKTINKAEAGFTLNLKPASFWPAALVMLVLLLMRLGIKLSSGNLKGFNAETVVFQATLPGLTEELIYRGLLLGILNKIYLPKFNLLKTHIGWGLLLQALLFGLVHGLHFNNSFEVVFSLQKFFMTFGLALVLGWLRERTGSTAPAIIFHNLWNLIVYA